MTELQQDLNRIASEAGYSVSGDFQQGQAWKFLSGGGYYEPHNVFIDEMWAEYRDFSLPSCSGTCCASDTVCNGTQSTASDCAVCCVGECTQCGNGVCDVGENCRADCCMTLAELAAVIDAWKLGNMDINEVMQAIIRWKNGC